MHYDTFRQSPLVISLKLSISAIWLIAKGKAFVHWTEQKMRGPGESRFKEVRHHSSTEEYFDYAIPLLTSSGKYQA
ncbi:hypothetical protein KUTeg_005878 [Tegillarca granosa]|uniref:Uncharacterized protein n=1 Tax=Tegillarca granosa TaxID=220873 RepID=A0ABQ9FGZ2_TEGGR|nr:hypothetical protein KUTeg_005878 [Tegillarca granosa]